MDKKQAQMKQQIAMMLAKKDYYDIMGVSKTATEVQIKKNYKKLAARFHPDKNNSPGSKQVFIKVTHAYQTLINAEQKGVYDRLNPEQPRDYHPHQDYAQFHQYDQIYRAFFGMNNFQRDDPRFPQSFTRGGAQPQANQKHQVNGYGIFLVILFLLYVITPLFISRPYHSLTASSQYSFRTSSDRLQNVYFVRDGFVEETRKDGNLKRRTDLQVDSVYFGNWEKTCDQATKLKNRYTYRANQYRIGTDRNYYLAEASRIDMSTCAKLKKIQRFHPDYVSKLVQHK